MCTLDPEDFLAFFHPVAPGLVDNDARPRKYMGDPGFGEDPTHDVCTSRVDEMLQQVDDLCGGSRGRGKAAVAAFRLLNTVSARMIAQTDDMLRVFGDVLRVGLKYRPGYQDWMANDLTGEQVALSLIALARNGHQICQRDRRRAFDLLCWFKCVKGMIPTLVAVNAVGVVLGLVDPQRAQLYGAAMTLHLHHADHNTMFVAAAADGASMVRDGKHLPAEALLDRIGAYDARPFRKMRKLAVYKALVADEIDETIRVNAKNDAVRTKREQEGLLRLHAQLLGKGRLKNVTSETVSSAAD